MEETVTPVGSKLKAFRGLRVALHQGLGRQRAWPKAPSISFPPWAATASAPRIPDSTLWPLPLWLKWPCVRFQRIQGTNPGGAYVSISDTLSAYLPLECVCRQAGCMKARHPPAGHFKGALRFRIESLTAPATVALFIPSSSPLFTF